MESPAWHVVLDLRHVTNTGTPIPASLLIRAQDNPVLNNVVSSTTFLSPPLDSQTPLRSVVYKINMLNAYRL